MKRQRNERGNAFSIVLSRTTKRNMRKARREGKQATWQEARAAARGYCVIALHK